MPGLFNGFTGICMEVDILINRFNNAKGGGLVALLQHRPWWQGPVPPADQQRKHGPPDAEHDRSQQRQDRSAPPPRCRSARASSRTRGTG